MLLPPARGMTRVRCVPDQVWCSSWGGSGFRHRLPPSAGTDKTGRVVASFTDTGSSSALAGCGKGEFRRGGRCIRL